MLSSGILVGRLQFMGVEEENTTIKFVGLGAEWCHVRKWQCIMHQWWQLAGKNAAASAAAAGAEIVWPAVAAGAAATT